MVGVHSVIFALFEQDSYKCPIFVEMEMAVCECNVVVAESDPQLPGKTSHSTPSSSISTKLGTLVCIAASIFGAPRPRRDVRAEYVTAPANCTW